MIWKHGKFDLFLESVSTKNNIGTTYGIARSIIAFGTLLTLITNNPKLLFNTTYARLNGRMSFFPFFDSYLNLFNALKSYTPYLPVAIASLILITTIIGYRPRFTGILHWWVSFSFVTSGVLIDGGDQIASNLTLMLIPITLFDNRKSHWQRVTEEDTTRYSTFKNITCYFIFLIIRLQICFIYLHASIGKLPVNEWADGTAVYYWLSDPYFGMNSWQAFLLKPFIINHAFVLVATWGIMAIELLLFMGIVMDKKYYPKLFIVGVLMHLSFLVFLGLFSFFFAITGGLVLYLLVPYNQSIEIINFRMRKIKIAKYESQ